MFVIKYDKGSMVKLVQAIQGQPAIYDTKIHYSKEEQDMAWNKVSQEVGEKDSLCRDRWHSIKSCYIRHLKYTALNSKRRAYYLAEHLDFLMPFVADRVKHFLTMKNSELASLPSYLKEALPAAAPSMASYFMQPLVCQPNLQLVKSEPVDVEEGEPVDVEGVDDEWDKRIEQPSSSKSKSKPKSLKPGATSCSFKKSKPGTSRNENEDVKFLKSLLPDVAKMSGHQKLKFKQEALSIIEDILYATDDLAAADQMTD